MKRKATKFLMALSLLLAVTACRGEDLAETTTTSSSEEHSELTGEIDLKGLPGDFTPEEYNIAALKGPTAMGLSKLMDDAMAGEDTKNTYNFTIAGSADEITPGLIQGNLDMACIPANLASVLYSKTEGEIVTLGINTLGVLYVVEKGGSVANVSDLKGKTVVAAGKGSTPEYALRYLLEQNDINPDTDLVIDFKSEHSECVVALAAGQADIALLPQPFVTVAQSKIEGLRIALDLNEEWDKLENGSALITGVVVARRDVVEKNPLAVKVFLKEYELSVEYTNEHVEDASEIIGALDIVEGDVAKVAIPYCNIVCITGDDMKEKLSGYLDVLKGANPESIGGKLPEENFYFR